MNPYVSQHEKQRPHLHNIIVNDKLINHKVEKPKSLVKLGDEHSKAAIVLDKDQMAKYTTDERLANNTIS